MLSSAYAQLGITQDCTRLVEKALGAAGIPVGDIGPMAFMKYGKVVGTPAPGDMVVQSGHVGIFVGNGQVLSGGRRPDGDGAWAKSPRDGPKRPEAG
jgi:cell wall-associated NlpC family hydrolase